MVLSKLPVPGRPTNLDYSRARAYCAYSRYGWGFVWTFYLSSIIFLFFLPVSGRQLVGWLVGWFGLNGPLRQYFSLYRTVSQREGERREK